MRSSNNRRVLIARHHIDLDRDFRWHGDVETEKSKLVQILVNLIKNAKESVLDHEPGPRKITLRIREARDHALFEVIDSGQGIAKENLTAIFSQGFTTKRDGHGFGLHASAIAAREMGGELTAASPGQGKGATFTLRVPKLSAARSATAITPDTAVTVPTPSTV